jgi:hypothetical protein
MFSWKMKFQDQTHGEPKKSCTYTHNMWQTGWW